MFHHKSRYDYIEENHHKDFIFTSPDIKNGGKIPIVFTCDGEDINPELRWFAAPRGTKSFVIIVDDPDAIPVVGFTFTHLAVINLPPTLRKLNQDQNFSEIKGAVPLLNDFKKIGYSGPCPPPGGGFHTYRFTIYALKSELIIPIKTKLTVEIFESTFSKIILDKAQFLGLYKRLNI